MGYGLPAIVGAGTAYGKRFVGIEGDGSLMFNLQELLTIRALNLPVRLFILNNRGYASIRNTQRNYFEGRYVGTGPEAKLLFPDFVKFAEMIGIPAMRIADASELREGVKHALKQDGPFICDVELEANEALWPKSAAIPMPDGSMVSMPLEDMSPLLSRDELRENMLGPLDPASERVQVPNTR
jgi:acetolactate synthase-1/2/3 large subunit